METGRTASRFRTTSWTLILRARESPGDLEELLRRYWSPIYAYLRRHGRSRADAEDLTQSFMMNVLLRRDLAGRADPQRGRFRSYLLTALKRYLIDDHRKNSGPTGDAAATFVPADALILAAVEPTPSDDPDRAFDRQWAVASFHEAVQRTMASCEAEQMQRQWRAYEARELLPKLNGVNPMPLAELMAELGVEKEQAIYDMVKTIKRKLLATLRAVISQTLDDADDVESELAALREML